MNSDTVDYEDACLIVRYLASMRPFAQSFDIYLTQVNCARSLSTVKQSWFLILNTFEVVCNTWSLLSTGICEVMRTLCVFISVLMENKCLFFFFLACACNFLCVCICKMIILNAHSKGLITECLNLYHSFCKMLAHLVMLTHEMYLNLI